MLSRVFMVCLCISHSVYVVFMNIIYNVFGDSCLFVFMVCLCISHSVYGVLTTPCAVALAQYRSVFRFDFWGLNLNIFAFHLILETCR